MAEGAHIVASEALKAVETSLPASFEALKSISDRHYNLTLDELLASVDTPKGRRQYARLIGVLVKEPFANEVARKPSKSTGAVFALHWKENAELRQAASSSNWQFEFMRALMGEERGKTLSDDEAFGELTYYKYESSLGKFIFEAFRDRICVDPKTSKALRDALAKAGKQGVKIMDPTTANLSVGAASLVAVAVASLLPATIAAVGAPVIGGVTLLILQIGLDGFCRWTRQVIEEADTVERTDG